MARTLILKLSSIAFAFFILLAGSLYSQPAKDWTILSTYSIPGKASGLAYDGTFFYFGIYGSEGDHVYKFDPSTGNSELLFVNSQINDCYGMTCDGANLYITDHVTSSSVPAYAMQLDLYGSILSQFDLPDHYMSGIAYDNGDFWVATYYPDPGTIYKIDNTGAVISQFTAPNEQPWDLCLEGSDLWVADYYADMLYKVDQSGNILESHESENIKPAGVVHDGQYLWYIDGGTGINSTLYKVDLGGTGNPQINVPITYYNYGDIAIGDSATWTCTIQNTGTTDLVLTNLIIQNAVPVFYYTTFPQTIAPGGSISIPIIYKPTEPGPLNTIAIIESNDVLNPQVELTLEGNAVFNGPHINVSATSHDYGNVRKNATTRWYLNIENNGSQPLEISGIELYDENFYLTSGISFPFNIYVLQTVHIGFWFNPGEQGNLSATAIISHNDPSQDPVSISLSGTGIEQDYPIGEEFWNYTITGGYDNSFKAITYIPDINSDGVADVIACSEDGFVRCFNGNSSGLADILWENESGTVYSQNGITSISDINNDGYDDVIVGLAWGVRAIKAISGETGSLVWLYDTHVYGDGGWVYQVCADFDYNNDGFPDVLASTGNDGSNTGPKRIFCLDGLSGTPIWDTYTDGPNFAVIGVEDFTGDGKPDVIGGASDNNETQGIVYGINGDNGNIVWSFNAGGTSVWALEQLDDINGDGFKDVVAGDFSGNFYLLNATNGNVQFSGSVGNKLILRFERLDDVNGDGYADIAIAQSGTNAVVFNGYNGQNIWLQSLSDKTWNIDRIADITGDGINDLIVGTLYTTNRGYFLDGVTGEELQSVYYGEAIDAIAAIPDITGDGSMEMVVGGRNGKLSCFSGGINSSMLMADFEADPTTGNAPLEVQFTDLSAGNITSWQWDFENDGTFDSWDQNPVWNYENGGNFTVKLIIGNGTATDTAIKEDYIYVDTVTGITNVQNSSDVNISPNPFNNKTTITISLKKESEISVEIFDLTGERIRTLANNKSYQPELLHFIWDRKTISGTFVKPGLYLCRIVINEEKHLRKVVVK